MYGIWILGVYLKPSAILINPSVWILGNVFFQLFVMEGLIKIAEGFNSIPNIQSPYLISILHPNSRFQIRKVVIKYEHGLFLLLITYLIKIPKVDIKPTGIISRVFSYYKHQLSEVIFLRFTKSIHMNKSSK